MPKKNSTANYDIHQLTKYRNGDSTAMEKLIIKYQNRIYNVILRLCNNRDDAAELTQETFIKAIEHFDKFNRQSSCYSWIFRIAVNLTISHCRRKAKVRFLSLDTASYTKSNETTTLKNFLTDNDLTEPSDIIAKKDFCRIIAKAMMKLNISQRAVIVLHDIEGATYVQTALILNIKLGTVKSRLTRGRNTLKTILRNRLNRIGC